MPRQTNRYTNYVLGPDGAPLTLTDLPDAKTTRWVARRKAEVVAAVDGGLISLEQACQKYALSIEEFLTWQRAFDRFGQSGLRATQTHDNRRAARARPPVTTARPSPSPSLEISISA